MIGLWYVANLERSPTSVDVAFCVACGGRPTEHVAVFAMPFVEAPYCADCAERARRKEWNIPLAMMAAAFVLPTLVVVQPFGAVGSALSFAFAASFIVPCLYVVFVTFRARVGGAVRAHKLMPVIQIDCARSDVAHALVRSYGGFVDPRRSERLTPAIAFVPLALLSCAFGYAVASYLFLSTIAIDNGGASDATVWIDGRETRVAPDKHATVEVRVGHHVIAWTRGEQRMEKPVDLDRKHDALVNPGPTTCYRKEMVYAGFLTAGDRAEIASAGLLPLAELQILPNVKHWFEPLPAVKKSELLEPNVEIGIQRDPRCTPFIRCEPVTECLRLAPDAQSRDACVARAPALCRDER